MSVSTSAPPDDVKSTSGTADPPLFDEFAAGVDGDVDCALYEFIVCTVVIGVICLFGLTGNLTSFVVLYKQHKTETAAIFLLQCMAVFDSLLLVVSVVIYTLPSVYPYTGRLKAINESFPYITLYVHRGIH